MRTRTGVDQLSFKVTTTKTTPVKNNKKEKRRLISKELSLGFRFFKDDFGAVVCCRREKKRKRRITRCKTIIKIMNGRKEVSERRFRSHFRANCRETHQLLTNLIDDAAAGEEYRLVGL